MYFKNGVVYVNFGGNAMVRFLAVRGDKVLTANLNLPGGTKEFGRAYFEKEFTEKQDVKAIPYAREVRKTDPKYKKSAYQVQD